MKDERQARFWPLSRRLTIYARVLVVIYLVAWGYWLLSGTGMTDRSGVPIGGDFSHYWVAASLALGGDPLAVYDFPRLLATEQQLFGFGYLAWFYPPTFLLLLLPLAFLPYLAALALWLCATLAGYLWVVRRIAPHPLTRSLALAFPGAFINLVYGQNGFLSVLLLGGGLLLLNRRPWAGGLLLGLLSYKPHLALLPLLALIAGRHGRALLGMVLAATGLALASALVLGFQVWPAFFHNLFWATRVLEMGQDTGVFPFNKVPSVFAAASLAGAGLPLAWLLQILAMLAMAVLVAWVWHRGGPLSLRGTVLVLGILLFTPYIALYDLVLLALPLAWLGWAGHSEGWLPEEQALLALGWLMPAWFSPLAKFTGVQAAPVILLLLLWLAWRRRERLSLSLSP